MPTQTTDGTPIPAAGTSDQYIPDIGGGWMYTVTTTITVAQTNLNDFQASVQDKIDQIATLQAQVDAAQPAMATVTTALSAKSAPLSAQTAAQTASPTP